MNCVQEFDHTVSDYALYKAKGERRRIAFLEGIAERHNLKKLTEEFPCGTWNIKPICEETLKDGLTMGKLWTLLAFVGVLCQREGTLCVAYEFLDFLRGRSWIPVLFQYVC